MARYTFVVLTDPVEGQDDDYNDWYTNQHLGDVVNVEGFISAQRFRLADTDPAQAFSHRYLALYEVETDDLEKVRQALSETPAERMPISPALDRDNAVACYFEPITDVVSR